MLVLSRKKNEVVRLKTQAGEWIEVVVAEIRGDKVRLGITAPQSTVIHRAEIWEQIERAESSESQE